MRRDKHYAPAGKFAQKVPEAHPFPGIEAACRLVKYQHLRVVEQGLGYAHAPLSAAGELFYFALINPRQREGFAELRYLFARRALFEALERGHVFEVVRDGELWVVAEALRQIAEHVAPGLAHIARVRAVAEDTAGRGRQYAREHAHERRLARAVRADKAPDSGRQREADGVDGGFLAKTFREVLYLNIHIQAPFPNLFREFQGILPALAPRAPRGRAPPRAAAKSPSAHSRSAPRRRRRQLR